MDVNSVIDKLCEKFGIAFEYAAENLPALIERVADYKITWAWVFMGILIFVALVLAGLTILASCSRHSDVFEIAVGCDIVYALIFFFAAGCQIFEIVKWSKIPDIAFYEYIGGML